MPGVAHCRILFRALRIGYAPDFKIYLEMRVALNLADLDSAQIRFLEKLTYLFWWQSREEMMAQPERVLAKAMNEAVWEDWRQLEVVFPREILRNVLTHSRFGEFHRGMWNYWHVRLFPDMRYKDIPPMPKRFADSPIEDGWEFWTRGRLGDGNS